MLLQGPVYLVTARGRYWRCDLNQKRRIVADRAEPDEWERFILEPLSDGTTAIQTFDRKYVACEEDGGLIGDREVVGDWEKFEVVKEEDGFVSIKSQLGFVCADQGGNLVAHRGAARARERFAAVRPGNARRTGVSFVDRLKKELVEKLYDIENAPGMTKDEKISRIQHLTCGVCAGVAVQPIPFADIFVLTPIQGVAAVKVAHIHGLQITDSEAMWT
ncbi:MAG: hypothetical protein P1V51_22700 [Deltaproteobacteria bacterium]|nr:hypothetical protein [Deltaproteobacteria bacterium]